MLVKEDFYPRRPTRASWLDAAPELALAAALALSPLLGRTEEAFALVAAEIPLLVLLGALASVLTIRRRALRWLALLYPLGAGLGGTLLWGVFTGGWRPFFAVAFLLAVHWRLWGPRQRELDGHLFAARCWLGFALAWVTVFLSFVPSAIVEGPLGRPDLAEAVQVASWGALLFLSLGLMDLFRLFEKPPEGAGPGWWRWDAPAA